jgi:hypothetical protein
MISIWLKKPFQNSELALMWSAIPALMGASKPETNKDH